MISKGWKEGSNANHYVVLTLLVFKEIEVVDIIVVHELPILHDKVIDSADLESIEWIAGERIVNEARSIRFKGLIMRMLTKIIVELMNSWSAWSNAISSCVRS